ncbi:hypothetical protein D3C78_1526220 [compost metagenome]
MDHVLEDARQPRGQQRQGKGLRGNIAQGRARGLEALDGLVDFREFGRGQHFDPVGALAQFRPQPGGRTRDVRGSQERTALDHFGHGVSFTVHDAGQSKEAYKIEQTNYFYKFIDRLNQ